MKPPPNPGDEPLRLAALQQYHLLDTLPDPALDDLTTLAANLCGTPISVISLVDGHRQWFKSKVGWSVSETPRDISFCGHALLQPEDVFVVPDAAQDERFADNPLVTQEPRIRFYAGAPLVTPGGQALGTLCIMDRVPRQLQPAQLEVLRVLGRQVMAQLELRRRTRELGENEARTQLLVKSSNIGLWDLNVLTNEVFFSPEWKSQLGYTDAEVPNRLEEWEGRLHPDDREPTLAAVEDFLAGRRTDYNVEFRLRHKDGSWRWILTRADITRDATGWPVRMMGCHIDLTDRKQAEALAQASYERFQIVARATNDAIWDWNLGTDTVWWNEGYETMFGYSLKETAHTGASWVQLIHPEDRDRVMHGIHDIFEHGGQVWKGEYRFRRRDGSYADILDRGQVLRDAQGKPMRMIGAMQDISARKMAEQKLQISEARYRTLFDYAPDGIVVADSESYYLDANASICRMLGYTREEMIGLHASDIVARAEIPQIDPALNTINSGSEYYREWQFRRKDGKVFAAEVIATKMPDGNLLGMIRDVTARKQVESHIRHLNRVHAIVSGINQIIVREQVPQAMLASTCLIAVEKGRFAMAWIGFATGPEGRQQITAHAGASADTLELLSGLLNDAERPDNCVFTRRALETGQPGICNDIEHDPLAAGWRDAAREREYRAMASLPLKVGGKITGTLNLYAHEPGFFDEEELQLLGELATDIGFALEVHAREAERRRVEQALRESEMRFSKAFQATPAAIVISTQAEGRYLDVNEYFLEMFGYERAEVIGRTAVELGVWAEPAQRAAILQMLETGQKVRDVEVVYRVKSGALRSALASAELIQLGDVACLLFMNHDLTALKEAEERFRSIFENAIEGIYQSTPAGRYLAVNPAMAHIFGYASPEEMVREVTDIGRQIYVSQERRQEFLHLIEQSNGAATFENEARRRDGRLIWIRQSSRLVRDPAGNLLYLEGSVEDITARKEAQAALAAERNLLRTLIDRLPGNIFVKDVSGRYLVSNQSHLKLLGAQSEAEVLGKTVFDFFPAAIAQAYTRDDEAVMQGGHPIVEQEELFESGGKRSWFFISKLPLRDEQGRPSGLIGIKYDITGRKQVEEALRDSELRFHSVWENSVDAMRLTDAEGNIVTVNEAFCRLVGMRRDELEGRPLTVTYAGAGSTAETLVKHETRFQQRTIAQRQERRMTFRNGRTADLDIANSFLELAGRPPLLLSLFRDVTERKLAVDSLRRSEASLREAQRVGKVGSWNVDLTRGTLEWSDETYRIYGRERGTFTPTSEAFYQAVHPDDRERVRQHATESRRTGRPYILDHRIQLPDGKERVVHEQAEIVQDAQGRAVGMIGTVQDITDRASLEAQLRQSQKMESIGQLAGGVAHDFNNLLTVIHGYGTILLAGDQPPEETADAAQQIVLASERAANLTRQLLAFSRRQVMQLRLLDLNEIVTSLTKMLQRIVGEDVGLQLHLFSRPLTTLADGGMLDQVLLNLVVNARDAMPGGGTLTIETGIRNLTPEAAAAMSDATPGNYVTLNVTDTGTGIAPENLARIFEPFFTTKEPGKGTGLGLATVFGIVKQHNGSLAVQSELGRGTTFQILLLAAETKDSSAAAAVKAKPRGGTETILLVEDEPGVRKLTRVVLERAGYQVLEASDGVEALDLWSRQSQPVHLLLTDIVMPKGVSGRELAGRLQASQPGLKVIFTSGYSADIAGRDLALQEGQNFIQKPAPIPKLLETVRRCLDS